MLITALIIGDVTMELSTFTRYFCRLSCLSFGFLICIQASLGRLCDVDFTDVASKTFQAELVVEARPHRVPSLGRGSKEGLVHFKVEQVLKGILEKVPGSKHYPTISVGMFGQRADHRRCLARFPNIALRYVLFLRPTDTDTGSDGGDTGSESGAESRSPRESELTLPSFLVTSLPEVASTKVVSAVKTSASSKYARKPKVKMQSNDLSLDSGGEMLLKCNVSGRPRPKVRWFRNDLQLDNRHHITIQDTKQGSTLSIRNLTSAESGRYRCQALNVVGRTSLQSTRGVTLSVRDAAESPKSHSTQCRTKKERENLCLHGGTCYLMPSVNRTFCVCVNNYIGRRCEEKTTPGIDARVVSARARAKLRRLLRI